MKTKIRKQSKRANDNGESRCVQCVVGLLAAMLEMEVLHCNKSASEAPEPYAPGFIVAGAVCKTLADRLRKYKGKQPNVKLTP